MTPQQRFALIMSRQGRFEWGEKYIPSTLALPREGPKGSRISRLNSRKLGRELHALSTPEKVFTQLALYHPYLIDLHEQKMLWPVTYGHPLRGHPMAKGFFLAPVKGTVEIAKELGFKHYEIGVDLADGRRVKMPFPYQGDLLLYLLGGESIPYVVNWTVKDRKEAFGERRLSSAKTPVQQSKDRAHAQLRTELEKVYYASAGIRTVQVSLDAVEPTVAANLDLLFMTHQLPLTLDPSLLSDFSGAVSEAVEQGDPVAYVAIRYAKRWGSRDQFIAKIYQDIWERKLPVNFFRPILIDRPLSTDGGDLLEAYGTLFQEKES
ncbi:hypothetical protein L6227_15985 [Pseudomonas syringae pv. syringae]|uniref:hypothetical protein n=1 Tax=Pseudomonas syringae TaxID=317 RepID=UPI001F0F7E3E|nr:hypothetical protein [Pseudomonas syringae]MCH5550779.1 hypothetical protein [Pseudomonas syringae pv. syringae]